MISFNVLSLTENILPMLLWLIALLCLVYQFFRIYCYNYDRQFGSKIYTWPIMPGGHAMTLDQIKRAHLIQNPKQKEQSDKK